MPSKPVPQAVLVGTCALLVALATALTRLHAAITADGAYFLFRVLETGDVSGPKPRALANAVRQAPVLLSSGLGVNDLRVLSYAYGVGEIVLPALVWVGAVVVARHDRMAFIAVATTAALCAGSTWMFSISETVLAVPLTVFLATLLWRQRWSVGHAALAVIAAVILVATYETALLTGLVLGTWAVVRARSAPTPQDRIGSWLVATGSAASIVVAIVGASGVGPGPRQAQSFLYFVVSFEPWPIYVAIVGLALVVAAFELPLGALGRRVMLAGGLGLLAAGVVYTDTSVTAAYEARGAASSAAVVLTGYLAWRWHRTRRHATRPHANPRALMTAVPLVAMGATLVLMLGAARDWSDDVDAFREQVTTREGIVVADDVLPPDNEGIWGWTALYLSLVVRSEPDDALLVDRNPSYVPLAPEEARRRLDDGYVWPR